MRSRVLLGLVAAGLLLSIACQEPGGSGGDASPSPTPIATPATEPTPTAEAPPLQAPRPPERATRSRVLRVIDGDTVVLSALSTGTVDSRTGGRRARLIGIDTPEVHGQQECFGREASSFAKRELEGKEVLVDFDVQPTDRFGRALVYIWTVDGAFFNARLVAEGYAQQATFPPNVRYVDLFRQLVRAARESNRGLWSACEEGGAAAPPEARPSRADGTSGGVQPAGEWDCPPDYPVKGNRGSNDWIHHEPGGTYYERTKPNECFDSTSSAQAAGYRAPRR